MKYIPMHVIYGGLDWYGFDVTIDRGVASVYPGHVGRSENPILLQNNVIKGGWHFEGAEVALQASDATIDVILYQGNPCLLVRSDDPHETFPEELDILFSLVWKEGKTWVAHTPWRTAAYEQDSQGGEHHSHRSRLLFTK